MVNWSESLLTSDWRRSPKLRWGGLHNTGKFRLSCGFLVVCELNGQACAAPVHCWNSEAQRITRLSSVDNPSLHDGTQMAIWVVLFRDQTVIHCSGLWVWHGQVLSSIYSARPWLHSRSLLPPRLGANVVCRETFWGGWGGGRGCLKLKCFFNHCCLNIFD